MSTGKRPIFAGERKGIDINGGRKATAIASMARKAEQSLYNSQRIDTAPFIGHSLSSNNSLATSQVNDASTVFISNDTIRTIAKQQAQKIIQQHMLSRDKSLNQSLMTLHRNIESVQKSLMAAIETNYQSIRQQFAQTQQQKEDNLNSGLKKIVEIINGRISEVEYKSVKSSFVDEMYQQIQGLHERVDGLQNNPLNTSLVKRQTQSMLTRQIESNFSKSMREVESLKKIVVQLSEEKSKIHKQMDQLTKSMQDIVSKQEQSMSRMQLLTKRSKGEEQLQRQLIKLRQELEQNTNKINLGLERLDSLDLQKITSSQSKEDKPVGQLAKIPNSSAINEPTVTSIIMGSQPTSNVLRRISSAGEMSSVDAISQNIQSVLSSQKQPQPENKQLYQIDKDGYLQDECGNYILDADDKPIKLNQDQIQSLKDSSMLLE